MNTLNYLKQVKEKFESGKATEHSYRPTLENFLKLLYQDKVQITNEPKRQKCGAPDFIISKKLRKISGGQAEIPIGYIEAKDIGKDLGELDKSNQLARYKESLDNLIFTDYLDFIFYKNGKQYERVKIAQINGGQIIFLSENFTKFENLLQNFITYSGQSINSSKELANIMARKAKLMNESFLSALKLEDDSGIKQQLRAFKDVLIHDITPEKFANIYAQTIAYGLFTARLHDKTLQDFSREESYDLIPKNNPFLRQLFRYVAVDIEDEIKWAVDELCEVFRAADVAAILGNFGESTGRSDPIIHFYEDFLKEFDPEVRKSRGVWYTPEAVVNFIIRAVDCVLKNDFGLKDGIADKSKIKIKREIAGITDNRTKSGRALEEVEVHKVQMLDIATGTGTFMAEAIKQIYQNYYQGQEGMWSSYVEEDLLPRLHGFEILMASYAMCHLKIDLLLKETGYKPKNEKKPQRLGVYLTNALEEVHKGYDELFASFLANESKEASRIKKETPVMVAFGNPPYSGESQNKGEWISDLMNSYKFEPGGKEKLKEKNPKWLNDDYVKFIRFSQNLVEKNGEGIIALINPHGFLDNPTFRGMRWHLLKTFDKIYTIDLHGNAKKKETAPDGSKDENVFDIQQGVSINVFVKKKFAVDCHDFASQNLAGDAPIKPMECDEATQNQAILPSPARSKSDEATQNQPHIGVIARTKSEATQAKKPLAQVFHFDLLGKRKEKYQFLLENSLTSTPFKKLEPQAPMYFFVPKNFGLLEEYEKGFGVNELFEVNGVGITSAHDEFVIKENAQELLKFYQDFQSSERNEDSLHQKFDVQKKHGWSILSGYDNIKNEPNLIKFIKPISYRPFDNRHIFYEKKLVWRTVEKVMQHFLRGENWGLATIRINKENEFSGVFMTRNLADARLSDRFITSVFPLYLYPEESNLNQTSRTPNLNPKIIAEIEQKLGMKFIPDHELPLTKSPSLEGRGSLIDFVARAITSHNTGLAPSPIAADGWSNAELATIPSPLKEGVCGNAELRKAPSPLAREGWGEGSFFNPLNLLDYIYAILHSPNYREKYKEFLKIDFPRAPYPSNKEEFWRLVSIGEELRQTHLLEGEKFAGVKNLITKFPIAGSNKIETINANSFILNPDDKRLGKVLINKEQYFENVPVVAWEFYIGGYQPAQKWLKDRKDRALNHDEILHYQKIILALFETDRLMKKIDSN